MAVRFAFRGGTSVPLEVEGLTPDLVACMSLAEIEKLPVLEGNRTARVADFFDVAGDPSDQSIHWQGDLTGVHFIGAKMKSGRIDIDGSAGRHVGSEMHGGEIHVQGNVGDWVGGEMHGGLIHVHGTAGDSVGAAFRGGAKGMTRGTILIDGDAGDEVGQRMRRGLIVVGGNVGNFVGFNMLAGTVVVLGRSGIRHGAGMRRGTIAFLGERPQLLPGFQYACRYQPLALSLLLRQVAAHGLPIADQLRSVEFDLYNGDMVEGGLGEMLLRAA